MRDGYVEVPITSRAAQAELERQQAKRAAALRAAAEEGGEGADQKSGLKLEKKSEPESPGDAPAPTDN